MNNYGFFAYLSRMKYIERWSLMRSTVKENIMEHSEQVAMFSHALATINNTMFGGNISVGDAVIYAIYHEASEVITGDLPTPIKYYNKDINDAYKHLEAIATEKLTAMLPEPLKNAFISSLSPATEEIKALVKAADKLAAYIKCLEELKCGNKEFLKARDTIYADLIAYNRDDLNYFLETFVSSYEKSLDELD